VISSKLDTATQLKISRLILQYHVKENYPLLEAFRKSAPFKVYSLRQLTSIRKGMSHALLEARLSLGKGLFWQVNQPVEVCVASGEVRPCTEIKELREFVAQPRKHKVLVIGTLDSHVQHLKSSVFDIVHLTSGVRPNKIRSTAIAADHTIVWVTKVSHSVTDLLSRMGVHIIYAKGLSSIRDSISILEQSIHHE